MKLQSNGFIHSTPAGSQGVTSITRCGSILPAVRIEDGKEVHQIDSGSYTAASPAIVGDLAYYGTFENEVLAVDLAQQTIAWRYLHSKRQFPFFSSAAVVGGRIVLGGRDKLVHCLDAATGQARW